MKKLKLVLIGFCFMLVFVGCKSTGMIPVEPVDVSNIDKNTVLVTFLRPSFMGSAIQFGMWDGEKFIGHLSSSSYIQYKTTPGKHLFLARAENWACVEADLEGGKSYFMIGNARMGAWRARVALDPVNKEDNISEERINQWLTKLNATGVDPAKIEAYESAGGQSVKAAMNNINSGKANCNVLNSDDNKF
ncbi:MAG: hypothetical protein GY707_00945 [Desulfobacteraceae bacterium]|nr:hypothetical protein [Desulfobacteraceae bacterium]